MGFDPTNTEELSNLRKCIADSRRQLKKYFANRTVLIDALHDPCHQAKEIASSERKPHNPLDRMVRITTRAVVSQNPTLRIANMSKPREQGMLRTQLHRWAKKVNLADSLQQFFQEALLRWAWMYTYYDVPASGNGMEPYVTVLDWDDTFIDLRGNVENEIDFEGHCYAKRLDEIQSNPSYDQNVVDEITEHARELYRHKTPTLYKWVDLRCVYLPVERAEVVMVGHDDSSTGPILKPLRVRAYDGPEWGPYIKMRLGEVRGTMIPPSRMSMLYDNHDLIVTLYNLLYTQADDYLEFYGYSGDAERDAEKHKTAFHGEYIKFDNPNGVVKYTKGGVSQPVLGVAMHADSLFDANAGNLKLLGGLGPSADTASQEAGLGAGVQAMVEDARQRMDKATKRIYEFAAHYIKRDPLRNEPVDWESPNGQTYQDEWTPEVGAALGDGDPDMEIIPGSMVSRSAEQQFQSLVESMQIIGSTLALPGEEPPVFKHRRFRELAAEYRNQPEIAEMYGEAPNQAAVVPGVESAQQFAANRTGRPRNGPSPQPDKMVEKMVFSGPQQQTN